MAGKTKVLSPEKDIGGGAIDGTITFQEGTTIQSRQQKDLLCVLLVLTGRLAMIGFNAPFAPLENLRWKMQMQHNVLNVPLENTKKMVQQKAPVMFVR